MGKKWEILLSTLVLKVASYQWYQDSTQNE